VICQFIAEHRARFGVAPICRVLSAHGCTIAPRTFYAWASRPPSQRRLSDLVLTGILAGYYEPDEHGRRPPESLYGSLKMWAHLNREGIQVAKCTVERLMRANAGRGCAGRRRSAPTIADLAADRAPEPVDR
jgi:hypothetical protein